MYSLFGVGDPSDSPQIVSSIGWYRPPERGGSLKFGLLGDDGGMDKEEPAPTNPDPRLAEILLLGGGGVGSGGWTGECGGEA